MGRPKKVKEVVKEVDAVEEVKGVSEVRKEVAELTPDQIRIAESREVLKHPLEEGQEFFEAPDGFIIVGEKGRGRVFYRAGNMYINPMR